MHTVALVSLPAFYSSFFFFNDTATTEIYTLSLHDALPICLFRHVGCRPSLLLGCPGQYGYSLDRNSQIHRDRKSTRLNSSHQIISYAVFCLKKKNRCPSSASEMLLLGTLLR